MIRNDVATCLNEATATLEELEHIGLSYQATFRPEERHTQPTSSDLEETRRRLERQFEERFPSGPLPVIRALQFHGFTAASQALEELLANVFKATSLLAMSYGVENDEVLEFDVQGTAASARTALANARESASAAHALLTGDEHRRAAAIAATLLIDAIARLGSEYCELLVDPDLAFSVGDESEVTNSEARRRTQQEFVALPVSSVCETLRLHGYEAQAASVTELASDVMRILSQTEAEEEQPDLCARRDAIAAQLLSAITHSPAST
jgi:hypothetical protein